MGRPPSKETLAIRDWIVMHVHGTREECATALGIEVSSKVWWRAQHTMLPEEKDVIDKLEREVGPTEGAIIDADFDDGALKAERDALAAERDALAAELKQARGEADLLRHRCAGLADDHDYLRWCYLTDQLARHGEEKGYADRKREDRIKLLPAMGGDQP